MFCRPLSTRRDGFCAIAIVIFTLMFLFSRVSVFATDKAAQAIDILQKAAEDCLTQKNYAGARDKYEQVLISYPDAVWSQCGLCRVAILSGDLATAQSETDKLLSDFSKHPEMVDALWQVALSYAETRDFEKVISLDRWALVNLPASDKMIYYQVSLVRTLIAVGDHAAAKIETNKLLSDYADNPAMTDMLFQAALMYSEVGQYEKVVQLDRWALANLPASDKMIHYQVSLVRTLIAVGDHAAAETETNKLLSDYADNPAMTDMLFQAALMYSEVGQYEKVVQLDRWALANLPANDKMIHYQVSLVRTLIAVGDHTAAETETNKLLSDYADNPAMTDMLFQVVLMYSEVGQYEKVVQLDRWALANLPASDKMTHYQVSLARTLIRQENIQDPNSIAEQPKDVSSIVKQLKEQYAENHESLSLALLHIGEEYYFAGRKQNQPECFEVSTSFIEDEIMPLNPTKYSAEIYYTLGLNYQHLANYVKAAQAFANAYQSNPNFHYADYCLYAQGRCYQKLIKAGTLSEEEAGPVITEIYSKLTSQHPQSPYRVPASSWLKR